ncbi:DNA-binding CsgD family transcriptional regulator [Mycolicibacterium sp. 624]|uniref:helix-turn-helix transcriptional regulator n=1 Tax=Mycolicibacterium sp. YH-1 TaxID=2908837 RepID=UPI001F4BF7EF|nr:LuxR C-terminal-related transcriptional regulator [Mycolicibacterium sp. YH-1]UNB53325.1 LuxR C-terminal-related transcriptional regulator [Mycolicibacterium sp. YH-1]
MSRPSPLVSIRRISAIVADSAPAQDRANAVLDELTNVFPYAAAQIAAWDDRASTHVTVASRGYTAYMRSALNGPVYRNDKVWPVLERQHDATFWRDCPFDRRESEFYVKAIEPNGFKEGATMLLRGTHGAYLGMFTVNLESATAPGEFEQQMLEIVGSGLVPLVDRLAAARQFAALIAPNQCCAALDYARGWVLLTGDDLPPPALLEAATDALRAAQRPVRFTWIDDVRGRRSRKGDPVGVSLIPLHDANYSALLCWQPMTLPYGLTRRELDVLAGLTAGLSNGEIANQLSTSTRTVTTHVEHILAKLTVGTRTAAALLADREGLVTLPENT